jgi:hypothetical protein
MVIFLYQVAFGNAPHFETASLFRRPERWVINCR